MLPGRRGLLLLQTLPNRLDSHLRCSMGHEAEAKRAEVQRQLMADAARLAALVAQTRRAKVLAEAALGAKLGRRINIQGGDLVAVLDGR